MTASPVSMQQKIEALSEDKAKLVQALMKRKSLVPQLVVPIAREYVHGSALARASWAQQRLWFIDQLEGGGSAYNVPIALRFSGALDVGALRCVFDELLRRHEALRSTFVTVDGELQQRIAAEQRFTLDVLDLRERERAQLDLEVRQLRHEEARQPFDLGRGPLIRGRLLQLSDEEHMLLITMHHIVCDGWSIAVLMREISALYGAYSEGRANPLQPLPIQYADYAVWQRQWLREDVLQEQLSFWRAHLEGALPELELPKDRPRRPVPSYRGDSVDVDLDSQLTAQLREVARTRGMTMFMVLHAAWCILLTRLSGQRDIVVGTPVANRQKPELEELVGFFVNTLPLRVQVTGEETLAELFERVKETTLHAYQHQDVPFEHIVETLRPERKLNRNPIFQVMFALQNAPKGLPKLPAVSVSLDTTLDETAKFDLLLTLEERGTEIVGTLNYAIDLFDRTTIERWAACFAVLLQQIVSASDRRIDQLRILPEDERQRVVHLFNDTRAAYPSEKVIHELFEEQAHRTPFAPALVYQSKVFTYAELNQQAERWALWLRNAGVGPEQLVALCMERGPNLVVALLSILKAGGAYLPLDPAYPSERLAYMMGDAEPRVLMTEKNVRERLPHTPAKVLTLDGEWESDHWSSDSGSMRLPARPGSLAYMIYTSGSTGQPKGALIEHRNVVNLWHGLEQLYAECPPCQRVALNASLNFDASVQQLVQLLSGRAVYPVPQQCRRDPSLLLSFLQEHQIDAIDCTPSQLRTWIAAGLLESIGCPLQMVLVGGEAIDAELWRSLSRCTQISFFNVYGPTECTVDATAARINGTREVAHIGRPMANRRVYILDATCQPVPIGVVGELYIGGEGVGRGYWQRPELTEQRFLRDPFENEESSRMYRTGDLGRWLADGTIECLGRNDDQVKIRGYRIEVGEIEAQLLDHPMIKEAAVIVREDVPGDKRLVAYVVSQAGGGAGGAGAEEWRAHLKAKLPEHMVPSAFVTLEHMPVAPSGKLDRRALPAPQAEAYVRREYRAPQGEMEEMLAAVWQSLLGVAQIGREDNFFELGGHSLLIMQMLDRLSRLGIRTQVRSAFESPTLAGLASALTAAVDEPTDVPAQLIPVDCRAIVPEMLPLVDLTSEQIERIVRSVPGGVSNVQDIYPLAPLQEGILFYHLLNAEGADTYVTPTVLAVSSPHRLQELIGALQGVIDRHDVLRTAILWEDLPQPVQVVYRRASLPVREIELEPDRDLQELVDDWLDLRRQKLDLRSAPLLRLEVAIDPSRAERYVLLQIHHIASDHATLELAIAEVVEHLEGRAHLLPAASQYREHVAHALAYARRHDAEGFFRSKLADVDEPTAPFGLLDVHGDGSSMLEARKPIEPGLGRRLRAQARRVAVSAATVFHAAWGLVVAHTSDRDDVVFGSVLLGRLQRGTGTQRMLGLFINTLPLRLQLRDVTARELVERTQRGLLDLLSHEQASLAVAQRCSGISGSVPLFTTLLNYRHSTPDNETGWSSADGVRMLASREWTNYPISLSVDDLGDDFQLKAQTDVRVDPQRLTAQLHAAVRALVEALEHSTDAPVMTLNILPEAERKQVVELFNRTEAPYCRHKAVHELFEAQAARTPLAVAVVSEDCSLTYAQLNERANRLARRLVDTGVASGDYVPILVPRSLHMLIAQLAVLKCGAAYVPMDPEMPAERRALMISDCRASRVVAGPDLGVQLEREGPHWIDCSDALHAESGPPSPNLALPVSGSTAAYVMYTSGSTGTPKGVVVPHSAVNNLAINPAYAEIGADDCIAHHSNPAFDASTFEVWGALLNGARLVLVPQSELLDGGRFAALLARERVTLLYLSVGLFNQYTEVLAGVFGRLRCLMVGGDSLEPGSIRRVLRTSPPQRLLNVYGPTECTTFATRHVITALDEQTTTIPIGQPITNAQIYILDAYRQPVPIGVVGEIHIGGAGVAHGYLNRPELTGERFMPNPFTDDPQARLYRTGDLARWRADGVIEFLGRRDHQVKIRGFRIELGEIEAQLLRHQHVKEAVVLARQDAPGEKRLVAYVVAAELGRRATIEELRTHLKSVLPEYMVPSAFVALERLPLTSTGKVDRRALPPPDLEAYLSRRYEAPQGDVEEILAGVWQSLLGVERVGRQDNFFELGGHSLLIVQMMERLRRVGLSVHMRRVFESSSLAQLAETLTDQALDPIPVPANRIPPDCERISPQMLPMVDLEPQHIDIIDRTTPGGCANIQDIYPLSPLQEGILFHHLLDGRCGDAYVLPTLFAVRSRERVEELIAALQNVIDRHDMLRTAVLWEHLPRPVQVVQRHALLPVERVELQSDQDPLQQVGAWLEPSEQHMDLRRAPLLQLRVAADPCSSRWYVLLKLHHIVTDGQSLQIVISEVVESMEGHAQQLPMPVPYRNHVAQTLAYSRTQDAETFFRGKLADVDEPTAPFGLLDVQSNGAEVDEVRQELHPNLSQCIRVQARRLAVSTATLFHAAWGLVVACATGRDDVVFGSVLLGRMHGEAGGQRVVGVFINTLPLRLRLQDVSAKGLVERTQRELIELLSHEQASLAVAQRCSGVAGSTALFSSLLNYRHSVPGQPARWGSADGIEVLASRNRTNYPITVSIDDLGDGFALIAQTDRRIDPHRVNAYLITALLALTSALKDAPHVPALALGVLPESERQEVLRSFNGETAYRQDKLVHELFAEQAQRTPHATAVVHGGQSLTYAELDAKADELARCLRELDVGRNDLVGICVERSVDMPIGLLGILKAGGAYVPLDPSYPTERLQYMLEDANPRVLLTQERISAKLPPTTMTVMLLDGVVRQLSTASKPAQPSGVAASIDERLVYVIYTSGSTGRPKGTAMQHSAMVNLIEWHRCSFQTCKLARVLQFAALSFDVAFQETFTTLCTGGTLVLLDEGVRRDARALSELLDRERIDRLFVPPLMLQSLAEHFNSTRHAPASLRDVITAGEQLRISEEIRALFRGLDRCRLHNHYGPTETHVVTALTLSGNPDEWPTLPTIGGPIANTQIYILNSQLQPVPVAVAGEIYVGGANVAWGYLRRPELTQQRFLEDPFAGHSSARLYKTGDLGRWRPDGTIDYLGRNDDQVKIRGFRIELSEIETQLARHAAVREAAVVVREDQPGEKRLIAYVTTRAVPGPSVEELRVFLKAALPEHMVPSAFVTLDRLPLTPSGKLNRRALPEPLQDAYAAREYEAPQGQVEQVLAAVWGTLLRIERIGRNDNFFEIGGHSLHGMKLIAQVEDRLSVRLPVAAVFRYPTVRQLAEAVESLLRLNAVISGSAQHPDGMDLGDAVELEEGVIAESPAPSIVSAGDGHHRTVSGRGDECV